MDKPNLGAPGSKPDLMMGVLDRYDVRYQQHRSGWQTVSCPNEFGHARGDEKPSARLNLTLGILTCMGCSMNGDAYTVLMVVEEIDFLAARAQLGNPEAATESDWIIAWVLIVGSRILWSLDQMAVGFLPA